MNVQTSSNTTTKKTVNITEDVQQAKEKSN